MISACGPASRRVPGFVSAGLRFFAGVLLALGIIASASTAEAAARNDAEAFVQRAVDRGYELLTDSRTSQTERQRQFRSFLLSLIDARRIAVFTLGRFANRARPDEIDEFTDVFADYIVAVFQSGLGRFRSQSIEVTGSNPVRGDVVVTCDIIDRSNRNARPYNVAFRVRQASDGRYFINDLNVEGIWQSLSERAEFTAFLQQHRGDIEELTNDLRRQTRQLGARA